MMKQVIFSTVALLAGSLAAPAAEVWIPGVDVNMADEEGDTPLDVAETEEIMRLLREAAEEDNNNTALLEAAEKGNSELLSQLIASGADVNTANKDGETPLSEAAYFGRTECVKLLIAAGADVNMATSSGYTPLDAAETEEIKQLLRAAGAW